MTGTNGVLTLQQIIETDFPRPVPVVDRLIDAGEIALLIARQKEGKSTLTLQFAIDVSRGDPFLGCYITSEQTVLLVDYENRFYRLKERGLDLANGRNVDNLHVKAFERISQRDVGLFGADFKRLSEHIGELRPGLLIIDPLRYALRFASPTLGRSSADEALALGIIDSVSKLQDKCPEMVVLLVHHLKKQQDSTGFATQLRTDPRTWIEKVYGSQALLAHVDTIWGLEQENEGYTFATVPRSMDPLILGLDKQPESERFLITAECRILFKTNQQRKAWDTLPQEFGWREAVELGISSNLLNAVIRQARAAGWLTQDPATKRYSKVIQQTET